MKRKELESEIQTVKEKIKHYEDNLNELCEQLIVLTEQEKQREKYISSSEIVSLIYKYVKKKINMSTIKRWADEGYLGEVIDEKDKFWALRSKQGKKRFLYPINVTYSFLFEKGYIYPIYDILDRVKVMKPENKPLIGIVIDSELKHAQFHYTIQLEATFELFPGVEEKYLSTYE